MQKTRYQVLIDTSLKLRAFVEWIGTAAALLFIPVVVITVWDVVARKLIWIQQFMMATFGNLFSSTILQELEWHFHTALFVLVFGYGFARNSHVRVDLVRARLTSRKQAWIEFWGTTLFAIPFGIVIVYFGYRFALQSYVTNEVSVSMIGLTASLDHQDDLRPGARRFARRHDCRLAADRRRAVRIEGHSVRADDAGMA